MEDEEERTVACTFKSIDKNGVIGDRYFFAVYGRSRQRLRGTFGSIEDADFNVSSGYFVEPDPNWHTKIGFVSDPKVVRITCETNKGRVSEATMYGRFWIAVPVCEPGEFVSDVIGYDADANKLYHYIFPEGRRIL